MGLGKEHAAQHPGDELWDSSWQESHGEQTIKLRSSPDNDTEGKRDSKNGNAAGVKLYTSWFCEFAHRAWIVLEEKGVDYEYIEVNPYEVHSSRPGGYTKLSLPLEEKRRLYPAFVAASPRGLVPGVDHQGVGLVWESLHVAAYVDEAFPADSTECKLTTSSNAGDVDLLPRGDNAAAALQRAHVRIWADHASERIWKAFYTLLFGQTAEQHEKGKQQLIKETRAFAQACAPVSEGAYFLGSRFSLVDVALASFWLRILWVGGHYRNLQLPRPEEDADFKRMAEWWEAVRERPSVKATLVCKERLIASYAQYADNTGTSDVAKQTQARMGK